MAPPNQAQLGSKEGRIALAINAYRSGYFTSIRSAAVSYDIPRSTLQARLQGRAPRHEKRSANLKLTDTEELVLVQWILSMSDRGLLVRIAHIRQKADLLLQKRTGSGEGRAYQVGQQWAYNFVRRHPSLHTHYNRKYDY
jgi:hypothetical protein